MKKKIRVIITDDHRIVRAGIKQIIEDCPDMTKADEAGDGQELLEKVRENSYDVILLDAAMPGRSGLDILKQLKEEKCPVPVLVLSVYPEEQYAIRALKAGASGYLTKASLPAGVACRTKDYRIPFPDSLYYCLKSYKLKIPRDIKICWFLSCRPGYNVYY